MSGFMRREPNWPYEEPLSQEQFVGTLLPEVQEMLEKQREQSPSVRAPLYRGGLVIHLDVDN